MIRSAFLGSLLALAFALAACGDGSDDAPPTTATLAGPLAYVVSECRENAAGFFLSSALLVRQGERDPITVMEISDIGPAQPLGVCRYVGGGLRHGGGLAQFGPFQRLAVSLDGSSLVFELSDEFSLLGNNFLTPELRGMFFVRTDGTGLRRLGPPSRHQSFIAGNTTNNRFDLVFSPDGRTVVFPDLGPGPDGEQASQIIALDLATGKRTQLTHLPQVPPIEDTAALCCPYFLDNDTIVFHTIANPEGLNPEGENVALIVNADGSGGLRVPPTVVDAPDSAIDPRFVITDEPSSVVLSVPGQPVNAIGPSSRISEMFFFDGHQNILQLTNFRRDDTRSFGGEARDRVYFIASADPLGTNPSNNCQIFSMASLGGDLRQLTHFYETERSRTHCYGGSRLGSGCVVSPFGRDVRNGILLFHSSCDPFGTNPNGHQLFAVRDDGTELRQLTDLRGLITEADGTVTAELPYPFVYPGPQSE
jgi:hypothetical protein